jgi:hypothetical protein
VSPAAADSGDGAARWWHLAPRQWVKIVVYSLLLVNFLHYFSVDLERAQHAAHSGWGIADWIGAFATTLDECAWFVLLFLLELETFLLDDSAFTRGRILLMHGIRLLCCMFIAHTVYAYSEYLLSLLQAPQLAQTDLCALADGSRTFSRNLQYWTLDAQNCATLGTGGPLYSFEQGQLITDAAGMRIELELALVDVVEASTWLFVLLVIELMVRLQERDITGGALMQSARAIKLLAFAVLWGAAAYWAYRGHWIFVWDEALWILGFMAIGANLSEWRQAIEAEEDPPPR